MLETDPTRRTSPQPPANPSLEGILAAAKSWRHKSEGTNLTDRIGLAGICLVFPEFYTVAEPMQRMITLTHSIDHIYDEGEDFCRIKGGPTNLELKERLFCDFHKLYAYKPEASGIYESMRGFLQQVETIERTAHEPTFLRDGEVRGYRELINAVYVRMMVSFGDQLVYKAPSDFAGQLFETYDYGELEVAYQDFCEGSWLDGVPHGQRSHVLFAWTMVVQELFDRHHATVNKRKAVPSLNSPDDLYVDRALRAGIRPSALMSAGLAIKSLMTIKSAAMYILPRYADERNILQSEE